MSEIVISVNSSSSESVQPVLPQFYVGREIFITGGTGFMGKVLVERLLWTCPEVESLFLLMRQKRDITPEKRLLQLKQSQVFEVIRARCPERLEKVRAMSGDMTLPLLGLDLQSLESLKNVSVIFHVAAMVKFEEPLRIAVEHNVRPIITLMKLAKTLPKLQVLMHVSTAFSNSELLEIKERIYPQTMSLEQLEEHLSSKSDEELEMIKPKLINPKPNTYTFTKAIAENVVQQFRAQTNYPIAIFRPTIVISSNRHPFPGWIENLNGPSGLIVSISKGILHVVLCRKNTRVDVVPVDYAIDIMLAAAWETATYCPAQVRIYNCSTCDNPITFVQCHRALLYHMEQFPLEDALWYPFNILLENRVAYKILQLTLQTIPLYIGEYVGRLCGFNNNLIAVNQKMRAMTEALEFFITREWWFHTDNVKGLRHRLTAADRAIYNLDINHIDWEEQYTNFISGLKKYFLRDNGKNIIKARRRMQRLAADPALLSDSDATGVVLEGFIPAKMYH